MIDYFEAYKKELITQYAQEEGHEVTNKDSEFWVDHIARGNQCDRDLMVLLRERDNAIVRAKKAESEISAEREKHRWKNYPDEKPDKSGGYFVEIVGSSGTFYDKRYYVKEFGFENIIGAITKWIELPEPPEREE